MSGANSGFDDDFMLAMLSDFLDESQGYLTSLNNNLLRLDECVGGSGADATDRIDSGVLNEMFRDAHSLKGLSAMLQLGDINRLTHRLENVFDAARGRKLAITRDAVDLMFQALDRLTGMVDALCEQDGREIEYESVVQAIGGLLDGGAEAAAIAEVSPPDPGSETGPNTALGHTEVENEPMSTDAQQDPMSTDDPQDSADGEAPHAAAEPSTPAPTQSDPTSAAEQASERGRGELPDPLFDVVDETEIPDKYLAIFIDETGESLDALSERLLGDEDADVDALLIRCHQIKGAAASIGLNRSAMLAHLMEDLLHELRESASPVTPQVSDALMFAVDSLRSFVERLQSSEPGADNFSEAYRTLRTVHSGGDGSAATSATPSETDADRPDPTTPPAAPDAADGQVAVEKPAAGSTASHDTAEPGSPASDPSGGPEGADPTSAADALSAPSPKPESSTSGTPDHGPASATVTGAGEPDGATTDGTTAAAQPAGVQSAAGDDDGTGDDGAAAEGQRQNCQPAESQGAERPDGLTSAERTRIAEAFAGCGRVLRGCVRIERGLPLSEVKASLILSRIEEIGDLYFSEPSEAELTKRQGVQRVVFGVATDQATDALRSRLELDGIVSLHVEEETLVPQTGDGTNDSPVASPPDVSPGVAAGETAGQKPAGAIAASAAEETRPAGRPTEAGEPPPTKAKPAETLRVDIERLDHLMNLAGQLVINKARFGQIGDRLRGFASRKQSAQCVTNIEGILKRILADANDATRSAGNPPAFLEQLETQCQHILGDLEVIQGDIAQLCDARQIVNEYSEAVHQLERVTDGIQKSVMDTRMLPIGPLFGRFKRVVRDITRNNGKQVQLVIRGEKTELDKRMIDELADPLIHMVRNAADHGIELPEAREAAGKPRQGTVTLDAFHRGNRIFIQVKDDGRGLDPEKLRQKAVARGIVSAADAERLTSQQAFQLIWEPGFSTAERVTEISGRGMGMDIVRSKIEQLNGTVEIDSEPGGGTTITVKLPLTMAILPSLLTVIAGDVFALPVESVIEIVRVGHDELATVHGLCTARVRGRVISVVKLSDLFSWRNNAVTDTDEERTLVIVGSDGNELGLVVDELLGEEDIVVKSLAENFRNVHGLAGASILGDGRVSLILDVAALLELSCRKPTARGGVAAESGPA